MDDKLLADITARIRESLPQAVAEELAATIKKAQKDASDLAVVKSELEAEKKRGDEARQLWAKVTADRDRLEQEVLKLRAEQAGVLEKERDLGQMLALNNMERDCAEKNAAFARELALAVFSNARYKYSRSVSGHMPVAIEGHPGQVIPSGYYSSSPPASGGVLPGAVSTVEIVEGEGEGS